MFCNFLKADYANLFYLLNLIAFIISLIILFKYASDTRRIANLSQEANLRPVILRSGYIQSWNALKPWTNSAKAAVPPTFLEFSILKNIAKDITGYIVIDHVQYELLFGHNISKVAEGAFAFERKWGWMQSGNVLSAVFSEASRQSTNQANTIVVDYQDIEGNKYRLTENSNFSPTTNKVS